MIADDPSLAEPVARRLAISNLGMALQKAAAADAVGPHIELQKILNRMGRLEPETKSLGGGGGFVFNVNFSDTKNAVRIEAAPAIDAGYDVEDPDA